MMKRGAAVEAIPQHIPGEQQLEDASLWRSWRFDEKKLSVLIALGVAMWFAAIGTGLLTVAVFSGAAHAADLPARTYTKAPPMAAPLYNWAGFYVGANAGGASSHECLTMTSVAGVAVFPNSEGCHDATGGLAGGQIGYRWQATNWVFGVEAQGDWADLKGSNGCLTAIVPYTNQTKIDAIGLATGQVGYAWNNVLCT
jgi:outer membrane immunogenic protein